MAFNQTANVQIDDNIKTDLILKEGVDLIPKVVNPSIQPVYNVLRRICNIAREASRTSSGTSAIYTTPTDRDFFLTGMHMAFQANATSDGTSLIFAFTPAGQSATTITIPKLTTTAITASLVKDFSIPIKLERGTAINITYAFAAGASTVSASITGFLNSSSQPAQQLQT